MCHPMRQDRIWRYSWIVFIVGNPWVTSCQPTPIPTLMGMGTGRCGYGTHEKNVICLKILESPFFLKKMVFRAFRVDLDRHYFFQNLVCIALIAFETF